VFKDFFSLIRCKKSRRLISNHIYSYMYIETYKLLTHRYDNRNDLPLLQLDFNDCTRGNYMKLVKNHVRYDMRKYFFTCRIINLWNSLPAHVVHASSVNDFKNKLDAYWSTQKMMYNYRAEISGTGNRSATT